MVLLIILLMVLLIVLLIVFLKSDFPEECYFLYSCCSAFVLLVEFTDCESLWIKASARSGVPNPRAAARYRSAAWLEPGRGKKVNK